MKFENIFIDHVTKGQKLYLLLIDFVHLNETDVLRTDVTVEEVEVIDVDKNRNIISVQKEIPSTIPILLDENGKTKNFYDGSQAFLEKPVLPKLPARNWEDREVLCAIMGKGYISSNDETAQLITVQFQHGKRMYNYDGCMRIYSDEEKFLKDSTLSLI